eukprot:gene2923-3735_t
MAGLINASGLRGLRGGENSLMLVGYNGACKDGFWTVSSTGSKYTHGEWQLLYNIPGPRQTPPVWKSINHPLPRDKDWKNPVTKEDIGDKVNVCYDKYNNAGALLLLAGDHAMAAGSCNNQEIIITGLIYNCDKGKSLLAAADEPPNTAGAVATTAAAATNHDVVTGTPQEYDAGVSVSGQPLVDPSANAPQAVKDSSIPWTPEEVVQHSWKYSENKQFILLDAYVQPDGPDKYQLVLLGDGKLPITFLDAAHYKSDLMCLWCPKCDVMQRNSVAASVTLMSGGIRTEDGYRYDAPDKRFKERLWSFSVGAAIHTAYITCPMPIPAKGALAKEELLIHNSNGTFKLNVDLRRAVPPPQMLPKLMESAPASGPYRAVHCLCPTYGSGVSGMKKRDPRLLAEWLDYHRALGFAHVHVYLQNYWDLASQRTLKEFLQETEADGHPFVTLHDWTSEKSD